jgi:hypothetical protein
VSNSFGNINGGMLGLLVTAAAEDATGALAPISRCATSARPRWAPALARATVIRPDVCEVRVVDRGNGDPLLATAVVATARAVG